MYAVRMLASLFFIGCFDLDMGQDIVGCTEVAKPCIFPFKYDGITYDENTPKDSKPWCSTVVHCDLAECAVGCSIIVGCQTGWVTCIFPIKSKGNTNNKCTTKDSEVPWCATGVDEGDENQVFKREWDECFDGCFELGNSTMAATTQEDTLGDTTNSSTMVPS
eukprot:GFUD01040401.1.p1 GENE.GFUD01040401.1~~GFUD01040401.1.p1  ORF type:complete len:163 (-),score=15.05 GFUD01040401.1:215-703(-)